MLRQRLFRLVLLLFGSSLLLITGVRLVVYDNPADLDWVVLYQHNEQPPNESIHSFVLFHPASGAQYEIARYQDEREFYHAAWSPDNLWLYTVHDSDASGYHIIYRTHRLTHERQSVSIPVDIVPRLDRCSSDGGYCIFVNGADSNTYDLIPLPFDNSIFSLPAPPEGHPYIGSAIWSSDDQWFIVPVSYPDSDTVDLFKINPADHTTELLASEQGHLWQWSLSLSPDNSKLLYNALTSVEDTDFTSTLNHLDLETGHVEVITEYRGAIRYFHWVNSEELILTYFVDTGSQSYSEISFWSNRFNIATGAISSLKKGANVDNIAWSLDSSRYAILDHRDSSVLIANADGSNPEVVDLGIGCSRRNCSLWWSNNDSLYIYRSLSNWRTGMYFEITPRRQVKQVLHLAAIGRSRYTSSPYRHASHHEWIHVVETGVDEPTSNLELISLRTRKTGRFHSAFQMVEPVTWTTIPAKPHNNSLAITIGNLCLILWITITYRAAKDPT